MEKEEGQISNLTHYYKVFRLRNSWEVSMQLPWNVWSVGGLRRKSRQRKRAGA